MSGSFPFRGSAGVGVFSASFDRLGMRAFGAYSSHPWSGKSMNRDDILRGGAAVPLSSE